MSYACSIAEPRPPAMPLSTRHAMEGETVVGLVVLQISKSRSSGVRLC